MVNRYLPIFAFLLLLNFAVAQPVNEFRAAWIATIENIDWPSRGNFDSDLQKNEFVDLLDRHRRNGFNAVIVQVRPATDAFYPSQYEPWSEWLTGRQGRPPVPYYDPLQFMIAETHKRGMEFHAWCNPYRAEASIGRSTIAPTHITRLHPEWFLSYGGKRYFDPGNKEAQQHVVSVIRDLVSRYDVDAIHFDDYFYPYRVPGQEFPDAVSYSRYGNGLNRADWRRSNVDSIILALSEVIKLENPYCKFGISPFGIWRNIDKDPRGSDTRGMSNYDDLYADILLWMEQGWIDYVLPQLYWEIGHRTAPFEVLADWWASHSNGCHVYIGHGVYRAFEANSPRWRNPRELPDQINMIRSIDGIEGSAYYSSKPLLRNPNGWADSLRNHYYRFWAIVPPMPWIDTLKPAAPQVKQQGDNGWLIKSNATVRYFILYNSSETVTAGTHAPANILQILGASNGQAVYYQPMHAGDGPVRVSVTAVSKGNIESDAVNLIE